jgi:hypothetical protein
LAGRIVLDVTFPAVVLVLIALSSASAVIATASVPDTITTPSTTSW